jgi:hypothetical protein
MTADFLQKADIDEPHFFWSALHRVHLMSHLRLYCKRVGRTIAIVTELGNNPSLSLNLGAEEALTAAIAQYQIAPATLLWIEHHCQGQTTPERFSLVLFSQNPCTYEYAALERHPLSRQEVAALIEGSNFPLARITRQLAELREEE